MEPILSALAFVRNELLLFAGFGLLIGGLDDLLIDFIYGARWLWRRTFIYSRMPRMSARDLPPPGATGPIAIFIPAWDESAVIVPMLRGCLDKWRDEDVHLFVGVYPNDRATIDALAGLIAERGEGPVTLVINPRDGPTTKADCLNQIWRAMRRWEHAERRRAVAIVLHDAEDVVHADALRVIGLLAPRFAMVQLPVLPLVSRRWGWGIAGHYCDEFAEAHGKSMLVREALGASLPSAGVGCAFNRVALGKVAAARDDWPFDAASLTEDYELGLRLGEAGGRGILVRMRDAQGGLIATREYFPHLFSAAVRQKARWTLGIALAGWDRLGWHGAWHEHWMRLRDRRSMLAALVLLAAYAGLLLTGMGLAAAWMRGQAAEPLPFPVPWLLWATFIMLIWRLGVRMMFVWLAYGPWQALLSVPRTFTANIIAMAAARRAMLIYIGHLRGKALDWDKTEHRFPDPAESGAT